MKNLYLAFITTLLVITFTITGFATNLTLGTYRPFGLTGYTSVVGYGDEYSVFVNGYDPLIEILYSDSNMIIASKSGEVSTYVCPNPNVAPELYYIYENGEVGYDGIHVGGSDSFIFLRDFPALDRVYYYGYSFYKY